MATTTRAMKAAAVLRAVESGKTIVLVPGGETEDCGAYVCVNDSTFTTLKRKGLISAPRKQAVTLTDAGRAFLAEASK
jgi:predicted RNA-binding protein YlxR (DUF448 family)